MAKLKVSRDVAIHGDRFALLVETCHSGVEIRTAVHRQRNERRQGGVRFVPQSSLEELGHLARSMTEKCAAAGVRLDGLKCVATGVGEASPREKAAMLAEHFRSVIAVDPGVIFGPDMGCAEDVLSEVAAFPGLLDHVTGLTAEWGGLEIDRRGYTALGLVAAIETALDGSLRMRSFAIQGFGAVGAHAARLIEERGGLVRAVSNKEGVLAADNGLSAARLFELWTQKGDACLADYERENAGLGMSFLPDREQIFHIRADVFVPAARTSVLAMRKEIAGLRAENPEVSDVEAFLRNSGVRLVVEGANHPLSESAEAFLESRGVTILPDILVNCGGMIGCRLEWENRGGSKTQVGAVDLDTLDQRCRAQILETVKRNVGEVRGRGRSGRATAKQIVRRAMGQ